MEHAGNPSLTSIVIGKQNILAQALWIVTFTLFTAIGAQIGIPHQPVPFTLQTFFVLMSGALLGKRNGAISQALYLFMGAAGVPAFSGWGFGIARLVGPTGGYLLSFPIAAFVVAYLSHQRPHLLSLILSMVVGLFVIFSLGTLQLNFVYLHDLSAAVTNGFLIFSWWDALKVFAAAGIAHQIMRRRTSTGGD